LQLSTQIMIAGTALIQERSAALIPFTANQVVNVLLGFFLRHNPDYFI
jgi:hypothetical protein